MFDVVHVKSANNNFPTPEFAKRVNLYADPEPCIKTFRRADFLSFIMIHQKLLLRYSLLPILDEKPRRNFQHRSPNKKGSPILERSSSREEQTLLSSPLQTLASTLRTSRAATNVKMKIAIMFRGEEEGHRHRGVQGSEQVVVIKLDGVCREKREADDEKSVAQSTIFDQHLKTAEDCSPRVFVSWQLARREGDYLERKIGSLEGFGFVWKALEHRGQDIV